MASLKYVLPIVALAVFFYDTYKKHNVLHKLSLKALQLQMKKKNSLKLIKENFKLIQAKEWKGLPPSLVLFPIITVPILVQHRIHHEADNNGDSTILNNKQEYPGFYQFYQVVIPPKNYLRFQEDFQGTVLKNASGSVGSGQALSFTDIISNRNQITDTNSFSSYVYCSKYDSNLIRLAKDFVDDVKEQIESEIRNQSKIESVTSDSFVYSPQKFVIQFKFEVNPGWWWSNFDANYKIIIGFKKSGARIIFTTSVGYWVEGGFAPIQNAILSALNSGKNQIEQQITSELNNISRNELSVVTLDNSVDFLINYSGDLCIASKV